MKNVLRNTLAALAVAAMISTVAKADPIITGGIAFASSLGTPNAVVITPDGPNHDAAFNGANLTGATGTFAAAIPFAAEANSSFAIATITLIGPDPAFTSAQLPPSWDNGGNLWSFTANSINYSFDPTDIFVTVGQGGASWILSGDGWISATGFQTTAGNFALTFSANTVTSFSATSDAVVPDGGTTALLLGVSLLGLGVYARRNKLAKV